MSGRIGLRAGVAVLALILTIAPGPTTAKSSANRISSISPTAAQRGALVKIQGDGFGAKNVQVSVAGIAAQVTSATGSRATFRVPQSAPIGPTTVRISSPGDQTGSIGFEVLGAATGAFDGNVTVRADPAAAVSALIGASAGTIEVEGITLELPAGAVPDGTTITLTPLRTLVGSPFGGAPVGVLMEPSGLVLLQPATLTLPRPAGSAPGAIATFGFNDNAQSFHLVPHVLSADAIRILIWHFSGAGGVVATAAELDALVAYTPTAAHERAERDIAQARADISAPPDVTSKRMALALFLWYQVSVLPNLQAAVSGTQAAFERAFAEWQAWLANMALYLDQPPPEDAAQLAADKSQAAAVALLAGRAQALRLLDLCNGASGIPLSALRNVIRLANVVNLVSMPIENGSVPKATELSSACLHVVIVGTVRATTFAAFRDNRVRVDAQVAFWAGSPSTTIPLRFKLIDTTDGANRTLVSELDSDGHWEANVRPTGLGPLRIDLEVDLGAADTDDVLKSMGDQRDIDVEVRERLELQGRRAGDLHFSDTIDPVATGGSVSLRIRLAGDNTTGVVVTLSHDGGGTVPASATTSNQGEATVTYTAPGTAGSDGITASLAEGTQDFLQITSRLPPVTRVAFRSPPVGQYLDAGGTTTLCVDVTDGDDNVLAAIPVAWSRSGPGSLSSASSLTSASGVACTDYEHPSGPILEGITAGVTATATANGAVGSSAVTLLPRWVRISLEVEPESAPGFVNGTNTTVALTPDEGARVRVTLTGPGATTADPLVPLADASVGQAITSGGGLLLDGSGIPLGSFFSLNAAGQAVITFDPSGSTGDTELRFFNPADGSPGVAATVTLDRTQPPVVILTPLRPSLGFGHTRQFAATIENLTNQGVTWSATGGAINQSGSYTAGSTAGIFTVTARSVADPTASATTEVQITAPTVEGRYTGTGCLRSGSGPCVSSNDAPTLFYFCGFQPIVGTGTVCGWSTRQGFEQVPHIAPLCQIETDGTRAEGPFIGRITFCQFGRSELQLIVRIEGAINNDMLTMSVFYPGEEGVEEERERYTLIKTF
ncbi:MAG TPA: IPT/TIG domain-containing protein, partial [Nonomuraea sp.]|nr:IPT/TIG domain-containing protein [Nonomuraea sp.]